MRKEVIHDPLYQSQYTLEDTRAEAKALLKAVKADDVAAVRRVSAYFAEAGASSKLSEMQLVIAREYAFESWTKLKQHLDLRADVALARANVHQLQQRLEASTPREKMPAEGKLHYCTFCAQSQHEVSKLAGPGVYICDACVGLCNDIIDDSQLAEPA